MKPDSKNTNGGNRKARQQKQADKNPRKKKKKKRQKNTKPKPWGTKAGTIKAHEAQTQDWGTDVGKADKPTE